MSVTVLDFSRRGHVPPSSGLDEVPLPPKYVLKDLERGAARFLSAVHLPLQSHGLSDRQRRSAEHDAAVYADFVRKAAPGEAHGIEVDDMFGFLRRATGHPTAWIAAWHVHRHAALLAGSGRGAAQIQTILAEAIEHAILARVRGFDI